MNPELAKTMRVERKPGALDVHPNFDAIVLTYEADIQILDFKDRPLHGEQKTIKKIIELPMVNSRTDCRALAKEVLLQCDLIHPSRFAEVEQSVYYIKKRKLRGGDKQLSKSDIANTNRATYNDLSTYIDLLYEGLPEKVKGAQLIQTLARDPESLEALSKNEILISAMGRVLREDWKRSIILSTHLVFTFFCFSMYSKFHHIILKCKVGSICMDIIDYELRRYDKWKAEMDGADQPSDIPIVKRTCPNSASMSEIPKSRIPEPVRPKSGHFSDLNMKAMEKSTEGSVLDDFTVSMESLEDKLTPEQKLKRFRTLVKKQEHLLRVAYYLLLNIAEDEAVEEKMSKRNIVGLLCEALNRNNQELSILVLTFLKKLSIMQSNKDQMANYNIIDKLQKTLSTGYMDTVHLTLKVLFNLSFDNKLRSKIIKANMIPKIVSYIGDDAHQDIALRLLYNLSYDVEAKFQFIDSIGLIIDMLLLNVGNPGAIMSALCVNLATYPELSRQMTKENRLQSLITRTFTFRDSKLMKLLHNISDSKENSASFIEYVGDISKAVVEMKNMDFVIECIGVLSNLHLPDLDWAEIFKHFGLAAWIKNIITTNNTDPELVLQVIVLLGTAAADENCAQLLCETGIIVALIDLLKTHQEDDEIVLQIVFVFYVTIWHESNIDYIITKTDVPAYLIDLLQDNNKNIRNVCNLCLNIISEHDKAWAERIRIEKFRHHNSQWLQMVDSHQLEPEPEEEDDDELPPYLNTEYLSQTVVRPVTAINKINDMELLEENEVEDDEDLGIIDDYDLEDL